MDYETFKSRTRNEPPVNSCCSCRTSLTFLTGRQTTSDGLVCDDCYFEQIGAELEKNPIAPPVRS